MCTPRFRVRDGVIMSAVEPTNPAGGAPGGFSPASRFLLATAAAGLCLAGLNFGRGIIAPLLLGAVLVLLVQPLRKALERKGSPKWLGTGVTILAAYAIITVLAVLLVYALGQFTILLTNMGPEIQASTQSVTDFLAKSGLGTNDALSISNWLQPSTLLHGLAAAGKELLDAGSLIVFAFIYIVYMAVDATFLDEMGKTLAKSHVARLSAVTEFVDSTRRYFVVNTIFGAMVAILDGLAVWMLGIPGAFIWAVLAFVTNYIPSVGFVIGMVPPAVIGGITGGWGLAVVVVVIYTLVNVVLQVFIQPRFVSRTVQMGLTLQFLSVVVWTSVLGPIGAILAVPLTLMVRLLLLSEDPDARWSRWLTGERAT